MTEKELADVLHEATMEALLYGTGLVKMCYLNGELEVSCVQREEFSPLAEHLKWMDENAINMEKQ